MSRPSKEQVLQRIHSEAMTEFDTIQSAVKDERMQCLQDRRFYSIAGAQWEGDLGDQFENKPKFEVNKVHLAVIRIINEYRNNRITVDFVSKDGSENDKLADACDGLYRADEQDSCAEEAYDNAFEEAVGGGFGAWRLRTEYEDEEDPEDEKQRIRIEPIFDADSSVFFDLDAKRQDKSDARCCFVLTAMSPETYMAEWNDDPASWPKDVFMHEYDWSTPDTVYVAEYYKVEKASETIHFYRSILGDEKSFTDDELTDEKLEELEATGYSEVRQKKIKSRRVHKYILSGSKVLEDCGYIAGKHIPIIPVYGKRWFVDNIERCMGHVRLAKDSQRLKNMQLSKLGELSAYSSVEKPIFTPEQVAGHQMMWAEDPVKEYPFLLVNAVTDANGNPMPTGPVGYTKPPAIPPAMAALLQITEQDMSDVLGNQQAGEQLQPNMSGKAVELIQNRLDMQAFIYMSNMAKAIKRSGEVWLSMAKDIFVEEGRELKTVTEQGKVGKIKLMQPTMGESGEIELENDLKDAKFDIDVQVGPTSSSKRAATVRALTGMLTITEDPETRQVLGAMAMMNMEGEGIQDARDYFRKKLLRMGVIQPTDEEAEKLDQEMEDQQQPSANDIYLAAAAESEQAKAEKARADTVLTVAKVDETKANTIKTLAEVDNAEREQALNIIREFGGMEQIPEPTINPEEMQEAVQQMPQEMPQDNMQGGEGIA